MDSSGASLVGFPCVALGILFGELIEKRGLTTGASWLGIVMLAGYGGGWILAFAIAGLLWHLGIPVK